MTKIKKLTRTISWMKAYLVACVLFATNLSPFLDGVCLGQEKSGLSNVEKEIDQLVLEFDGSMGRLDLNPKYYMKLDLTLEAEKQDYSGIANGRYDRLVVVDNSFKRSKTHSRRWYRVLIQNNSNQEHKVILANAIPIRSLYVLEGHSPEKKHVAGLLHLQVQDPYSVSPAVKLTLKPGLNRVYLGVNSLGNINFFMMSLWKYQDFEEYEKERLTFSSICFGAFIALWVYNLVLFLLMRQKVYFFYILFCTGLLLLEGIIGGAYLAFERNHFGNMQYYWPAAVTLTLVGFSLFTSEFADLPAEQKKPWEGRIYIALGLMILSAFGFYLGIGELSGLLLIFAVGVLLLLTIHIYKILLSSIEIYYLLISCIPLIVSSVMLILQITLVMDFNFRIIWFQIGSALLHVILVSTALGTKANSDRAEKVRLQSSIDLGRAVQELLLPKSMKDNLNSFDYAFCYVPSEGTLSGDWINHWTTKDGAAHFILGSVLGEKVQAALAVASIATVIERARDLSINLDVCLKDINDTLFHLFSARIGTKASGVSVFQDGSMDFWNFGGAGWCIYKKNQSKAIIKNDGILGKAEIQIGQGTRSTLDEINVSYVFSDGFAKDHHGLKGFQEQLSQGTYRDVSSDALCKIALDLSVSQVASGSDSQDHDRSMLVITSRGGKR